MSAIHQVLLAGGAAAYQVPYSLRFRASASARLTRTYGATGSSQKFTGSVWIKRGILGSVQSIFGAQNTGAATWDFFAFNASDQLQLFIDPGTTPYNVITTAVFRDPSAWYHVVFSVDTTQATAANRVRIYVNNVEQSLGTNTIPQNYNLRFNVSGNTAGIGTEVNYAATTGPAKVIDGYFAEINWVDGQQLTPSSFGQTDSATGVWVPKKYSGTYGNNGFYLKFADASAATATAIGKDSSGNGNNWTPSGISVTSGVTFDQMLDTPTLNYCTGNPLSRYTTNTYNFTSGNLDVEMFDSSNVQIQTRMSMGVNSGKWYWEATLVSYSIYQPSLGVAADNVLNGAYVGSTALQWGVYGPTGEKFNAGIASTYGSAAVANDVIQIALDMDNGKIWWGKNGTWFASGDPASGTNAAFTNLAGNTVLPAMGVGGTTNAGGKYAFNFGQRAFAYTPPTGFKALNTANLPTPSIKKGSLYMNATLRTGTGATASVSSLGFQPDLVWIKSRSAATDHGLYDAVRGVQKQLESNTTTAETTETTGLTAFNSNGYTVGALAQLNTNTATYVDWAWKEGVTPGFDIVAYTGTGSALNVSHTLGAVPKFMVIKAKDNTVADNWGVYHGSLPNTQNLYLNLTNAAATASMWNSTTPTSSVFTVGANNDVNRSGINYISYLWSEIEGFSKFGSYTGNGSTDGPFVWCGHRPRWLMIKDATTANLGWRIYDTVRETFNEMGGGLEASSAAAENYAMSVRAIDILSNGFKIRVSASGLNGSGVVFIFAAFAENPFKYARAR